MFRSSSNQQSSLRRSRKDPCAFNKSFFDKDLLESASDTILKIVHPGKSDLNQKKREENRDKIRKHVLRVMKPLESSKEFRYGPKNRVLPESSQCIKSQITSRKIPDDTDKAADASCPIEARKMHVKSKLTTLNRTSCNSSSEIPTRNFAKQYKSTMKPVSPPVLKKRVSFVSPPDDRSKRASHFPPVTVERVSTKKRRPAVSASFRTPPRTETKRFSEPPPLINVKRGFIVTDSPGKLNICHQLKTENSRNPMKEEKSTADALPPPPVTKEDSDADCSGFDFDAILKTPERIEEPYDLLGLASFVSKEEPKITQLLF